MYKRQRSLKEAYLKVHRDYENISGESKNGNHSCLKFPFSPEGTNEEYDFELFDVEDQADKGKSW